jgi:hypothetical protein
MATKVLAVRKWHSLTVISYNVLFTVSLSNVVSQPDIFLDAVLTSGDKSDTKSRNVTIKASSADVAPAGYYYKNGKKFNLTSFVNEMDEELFPLDSIVGDVYFSVPLQRGERFLIGEVRYK